MASKEQVARAIAELQIIEQIVNEFQLRLATLDAALREHENAISFIEEMKKAEGSMEVLIPIGGGNFVHGIITSTDKMEVSVGADVIITKSLDEGYQIMLKRKDNLIRMKEAYLQRLQEHLNRAAELRRFLESVRTE
ncbi:MAG: prefoldin subunit alpha [Thaumarchaeota archaeon]|nr:prefoldin subunit alpha [Candidatus Terraquivivens yellowstonensis]MCL7387628.1 prefoldin subunit alpha [Candidatus Terraquivivens yellowstonensis]MCL7392708.1 prefoldin subunit alpha [Candidatus Terraquivivens yellowstonensis]MCL7395444.1 prefoldin subunit alpha [Candidatus Terraquivivens yellowstonensis]MCL7398338.1 prefoldin subunit alpha [Candidatus Terraquivivens yellowstonensis]